MKRAIALAATGLSLWLVARMPADAGEIEYPQVIKTRYEAADPKLGGQFVIWSEREKIFYGLDPKLFPAVRMWTSPSSLRWPVHHVDLYRDQNHYRVAIGLSLSHRKCEVSCQRHDAQIKQFSGRRWHDAVNCPRRGQIPAKVSAMFRPMPRGAA